MIDADDWTPGAAAPGVVMQFDNILNLWLVVLFTKGYHRFEVTDIDGRTIAKNNGERRGCVAPQM